MASTLYVSVRVVCPACGVDKKFSFAPIDTCRSCGAEYPLQLRQDAEADLARQKAPRPRLLTAAMYLSAAFGLLCLLSIAQAAVDAGEYKVNNVRVTGPQFLAVAGLPLSAAALITLGIAYSLFRHRWWSRLLIALSSAAAVLTALVTALVIAERPWPAIAQTLLAGAIAVVPIAAYLFFNPSAAAYYDARRPVRRENRGGHSHGA